MNNEDTSTVATAAVNASAGAAGGTGSVTTIVVTVCAIIGGACATGAAHHKSAGRSRKCHATEAAVGGVGGRKTIPTVATLSACAAISAGATAGIFCITGRIAVRATTSCITGSAARRTSAGERISQSATIRVGGSAGGSNGGRGNIARSSGNTFALGAIGGIGGRRDVICDATGAWASKQPGPAATESLGIQSNGATKSELRRDVKGENTAESAGPSQGNQART